MIPEGEVFLWFCGLVLPEEHRTEVNEEFPMLT